MASLFFEGPGGVDEGVHAFIDQNAERYVSPAIEMLKESKEGSREEETALLFIELSKLNNQQIKELLDFVEKADRFRTKELLVKILPPQEG